MSTYEHVVSEAADITPSGIDSARQHARSVATMSVAQAADVLGVHVQTVWRMIQRGTLHPLPRTSSGPGSAPYRLDRAEVRKVARALAVVPPIRRMSAAELSARGSSGTPAAATDAPGRGAGGHT